MKEWGSAAAFSRNLVVDEQEASSLTETEASLEGGRSPYISAEAGGVESSASKVQALRRWSNLRRHSYNIVKVGSEAAHVPKLVPSGAEHC